MQDQATAPPVVSRLGTATPRPETSPTTRRVVSFVLVLATVVGVWELYKLVGNATGGTIPFTSVPLPIRPDDKSMPHTWDMIGALFQPRQRGSEELLLFFLLKNALFTWREALTGFLTGTVTGFGLGVAFAGSRLLERSFMPYVVASQTVPLIAIAPMVVIWGSAVGWPAWVSVSIIAAYLTFFPVTINTLRGLLSPPATATELMRSYAASPSQVLWKLQVPAALPYVFTALKVSATASVIGAIIGELPAGLNQGLGRSLLTFSYYYISGPEKLYAAILVAALLGIVFVGMVTAAERLVVGWTRRPGVDRRTA